MSSGWLSVPGSPPLVAEHLLTVEETLGAEEPDGQLRLVARGPHRDGDGDRLLARTGCPDLERRLADDAVIADLERFAANRHDPPAGHVPDGRDRVAGQVGHVRHRPIIGGDAADPLCPASQRAFLDGVQASGPGDDRPDGHPRLVPICFVVAGEPPVLYTPIDDKPKRTDDPLALARVRDIRADPRVTVLVDRWDEDWTRLAWLRCIGSATVIAATATDHPDVIAALRAKYPPYVGHRLEVRPLIRVTIEHVTSWSAIDERRQ